mmetsp:Transcript_2515/g.3704  ORF Transcript_2515/g.3704 Transcript_2515/m.3704 type:complete len:614 (+) Transcript_2515:37-1878(+)
MKILSLSSTFLLFVFAANGQIENESYDEDVVNYEDTINDLLDDMQHFQNPGDVYDTSEADTDEIVESEEEKNAYGTSEADTDEIGGSEEDENSGSGAEENDGEDAASRDDMFVENWEGTNAGNDPKGDGESILSDISSLPNVSFDFANAKNYLRGRSDDSEDNKNDDGSDDESHGRRLQAASMSKNVYAIAYEPGTRVRVNRDHLTHTPVNRIDMSGRSGGPYNIVAALDGTVMFIEDSYNNSGGACATNNYVWLSHSNGEWTKYSHLAHDSASVDAGLSVGDKVKVGQFIGIEDDVGCASGDHLHWEVAVPNNLADPINPVGGYIKGVNLIPRICGIPNNIYVAGTTYTVPRVRPGWGEYARHGLPESAFQADFNAAARCGYRMDWNSGYDKGFNSPAYNVVYHPNKSPSVSWKSHRRLTKSQLTSKISTYGSQGYKLVHIDIYKVGSAIRYAAIFKKGNSVPNVATYHGVSAATHQAYFDFWKQYGWKPRVISVTSINGSRQYAAVYTKSYIGSWFAKSQQTSSQYQANFNANKNSGRRLIYLKSYVHNNKRYYSAIWASQVNSYVYAKHGLTSNSYQNYFNTLGASGYETSAVSATKVSGKTRWAAFWEK